MQKKKDQDQTMQNKRKDSTCSDKVFCILCDFYYKAPWYNLAYSGTQQCKNPEAQKDTWKAPKSEILHPWDLNKNNDCPHFTPEGEIKWPRE